ncbi:MAG: hypothetical protein A2622_09815 [Bdellovibrionales bacterium RIFCSPHIGHO2_01_FULL_40_29]|nr:MAG: hypothetical protein A2622_09815 [Bdellovibrionales bacterium RIFCSPHIGHO2_01_FULL_40_29]OFZ32455.1 MAG: hypothetical protein A3D17_12845 [Bdellovibrionales bacterium RIFCSPHIGHO2_02_FULL_40_15]
MVNSQLFLYLNIVIGILFVAYFLFFRGKPQQPTKLNVKAKEDFTKSIVKTQDLPPPLEARFSESKKVTVLEPEVISQTVISIKVRPAKNLGIYFVYNGHEWECHEVLGVPQGASLPVVTESYQQLIKTSDPSTFQFYESAYQGILSRWRDRL